jgi:hypothetical protein
VADGDDAGRQDAVVGRADVALAIAGKRRGQELRGALRAGAWDRHTLPGYNRRSFINVHSIPVLRDTRFIRTFACFIWAERHRAGSFVGG